MLLLDEYEVFGVRNNMPLILHSLSYPLQLRILWAAFYEHVVKLRTPTDKELKGLLKKTKELLAKGARPDVRVTKASVICEGVITHICGLRSPPHLDAHLLACVQAPLTPPVNLHVVYKTNTENLSSPLSDAILSGNLSYARILLENGADARLPCFEHRDGGKPARLFPIQLVVLAAMHHGSNNAVEMLDLVVAHGADVDAHDPEFVNEANHLAVTPLIAAVNGIARDQSNTPRLEPVALKLMEYGAAVDARDVYQHRPLDLAAPLPSTVIVKALLAKGADPSPVPYVSQTLAAYGHAEIGNHYIQAAVAGHRTDILGIAAEVGVNLKKIYTLGHRSTPLLAYASNTNSLASARYLIEYGVDVNEVYKCLRETPSGELELKKWTALDDAIEMQREDIEALIRAAGGNTYEEIRAAKEGR